MRVRPLLRLLLLLAYLGIAAAPTKADAFWSETRHSAALPDGQRLIRTENPSEAGSANSLLYSAGMVEEVPMTAVADGPSTVAALAPGPAALRRYYGFRYLHGGEIDFQPVRLADGSAPTPGLLTRVATDPAGDHLFNLTHLDLVDCRVSFDGTRLVAALRNSGGGFPVNSGLTFFGYLLGIVDPSDADPDIVFAMLYTYNQTGVISPGLYKIYGTGLNDLVKIGEVTHTVFAAENTLVLTCQLANLYSDPDFASWFDPVERRISVAGFTQKIPLIGGAQEADRTQGGDCYLRELWIDPGVNHLPAVQAMQIGGAGTGAFVQVSYVDSDAHCPVLSEVRFDGGAAYPMRPQTLNYAGTVVYRSAPGIAPLVAGGWSVATARFSDNQSDIVEAQLSSAGMPGDEADDSSSPEGTVASAWCAPNPSRTEVVFRTRDWSAPPRSVVILDAQGRLISTCLPDDGEAAAPMLRWDGRGADGRLVPAGCYFWSIRAPGGVVGGTLVRVR